jgi:hypothetical protein
MPGASQENKAEALAIMDEAKKAESDILHKKTDG